ncbi:MAG: hypothetical protein IJT43_03555 [Stomatobaculum sp.]|nr:hypothetical protein [Stomatobaculum sp.]
MKEKSVLLTTLGSTGGDRLDYQYYYYDNHGQLSYCNSLSIAEAGTKYILSQKNIDEIIVLGSGATYNVEDALRPLVLRNFEDYSAEGIENLSEYSFFRYRIAQFMEDIDVEGADVLESIEPDRQKEIMEAFRSLCEQAERIPGLRVTQKEAFHLLNRTPELQSLMGQQLSGFSDEEMRWLRQYLFARLDPAYKMHVSEYNEKIQMCFVPLARKKNLMLPLDNILEIVKAVYSDDPDHIHLYMDMQGIGSADGFTLISVFSMIANDATRQISIRGLITTYSLPSRFASPIDDQEMKRYDINLLVAGMNSFLNYGKVDLIRDYWYSRHIDHPRIELLIYGMQNVADGISLCDLANLEYGIRILQKVFSVPDTDHKAELESNIFRLISRTIQMDYGRLLTEEKISGLELVKWAYRKKFYQQTLTIIESKIPLEIVEKGILYYARDEESRLHMLQSLRLCYEKAHPAQRWTFKDPDHYFIKFYGRSLPGANPINGERSHAYAVLRVLELFEDHDDFVQAYSVLSGKRHLLLRLMESYYHIGDVRNAVNHAEEKAPVISLENINVRSENENLLLMQKAIEDFIRAYEEVLNAVEHVPEAPVIRISGEEFRTWYAEQTRGGKRKRQEAGRRNSEQSGKAEESENRKEASAPDGTQAPAPARRKRRRRRKKRAPGESESSS